MSWAIGYDSNYDRDIGYGVPSVCDHPGCNAEIDRGLGCVCGGEPYGGDKGCGLFFCSKHLYASPQVCECCHDGKEPFEPKPDTDEWNHHKLTDESWAKWREENPFRVREIQLEWMKRLNKTVYEVSMHFKTSVQEVWKNIDEERKNHE